MEFPYGKAPLAILIIALGLGAHQLVIALSGVVGDKPDLIFATFTKEHAATYRPIIQKFEEKHVIDADTGEVFALDDPNIEQLRAERDLHPVNIQFQVVDQRALQSRLQSALQVGADVPDMVEIMDPTMGIFLKGPLEDVGFVDLTDKVHETGLYNKLVTSRFKKWSSRGRIFALPHDVHPTVLAYRRDIVEDELGIDVSKLDTWDKFVEVGQQVTKDLDGDGVPDRYMIDLPVAEPWGVKVLMRQRGGSLFDENGRVAFDSDAVIDVVTWYVQQVEGPDRISFPAAWGQTLARSMIDGLCLFYIAPDWRTRQFQMDVPSLEGKMAIMPLPAWEEGGLRTSTWGGTGLAITKQCKEEGKFDLAWQLAMYIYYDPAELGERFASTNILPPLVEAWDEPEIHQTHWFYKQKIGEVFAALAPQVPEEQSSPYVTTAEAKLVEAYINALLYYQKLLKTDLGEQEIQTRLRDYAAKELHRTANQVRRTMSRNVFLAVTDENAPQAEQGEAQ